MTDASASPTDRLHRVPRRPHAWTWCLALSQLAVVAIWWRWGWQAGFGAVGVPGLTVDRQCTSGLDAVGLAEDKAEASVACRQVGNLGFSGQLPRQEEVFTERASIFFKHVRVVRMVDARRNALVSVSPAIGPLRMLTAGAPGDGPTADARVRRQPRALPLRDRFARRRCGAQCGRCEGRFAGRRAWRPR